MTESDNNKTIKSAIDGIIPADGAKERMLANIKRKADAQKPKPITVKLTKWTAPLAACLAVAVITAVGVRVIPMLNETLVVSEPMKVENPVRLVDSAAAFTKELGITADAPEGSKNIQYMIVDDEIAEISFMYKSIDYTLRASKQSGDFSGIDGTAVLSELIDNGNNAMLTTVTDNSSDTFLKLEWNAGKTRYILSCSDHEAGENSPNIKNSDPGSYSRTEAAYNIIDVYKSIIKI